ncbi:MAG: ArnT family glycosyltransferase [Caulobacterales bacterium]
MTFRPLPSLLEHDPLDRLARSRFAILALLLIAIFAASQGMGSIPVLDRDEARFAQATKQMIETGDYVRIFVQDEPRNKKPIGIHWIQAATASLTTTTEIWGYRLASMLGLCAAVIGTFWAGSSLVGRTPAFAGAAVFAVGLLASTEGMIAKTDAALCGATALAMAALARLYVGHGGKWSAIGVWAAIGAGILLKGPVTAMTVGLAVLALCFWERRWGWLRPLGHWAGPLVASVIVLPWMIAIGLATDGTFFAQALGGDLGPKVAGGHEGHAGPPGYHLLLAPLLLFPATALLLPAAKIAASAVRSPRAEPESAGARFLLAWIIPTWLVFEILPTKLAHYTLPTYPAIALLAGMALFAVVAKPWPKRLASAGVFLLAGAGLIAIAAAIATYMPGDAIADERRAVQAALVGGVGIVVAVGGFLASRTAATMLAMLLATGFVSLYGLRERLLPEARELLVSDQAKRALSRAIPDWRDAPSGTVIIVGYRETSLVFETKTDVRLMSAEQAAHLAQADDVAIVNETTESLAAMNDGLLARGLVFTSVGPPVTGLNYSNGDQTVLQPGRIELRPN